MNFSKFVVSMFLQIQKSFRMKLSPLILILKEAVLAWDGPWDGVNVLTDDVLQSNDLMELNRDPKLTFIGRVS